MSIEPKFVSRCEGLFFVVPRIAAETRNVVAVVAAAVVVVVSAVVVVVAAAANVGQQQIAICLCQQKFFSSERKKRTLSPNWDFISVRDQTDSEIWFIKWQSFWNAVNFRKPSNPLVGASRVGLTSQVRIPFNVK